jgi:gamma-glutamylcyclotransferase (GGCT)/AIG2-like uncharacterized protein YtfP
MIYLAAYGTLRSGCQGQEHLGIELGSHGAATLPGRLWLTPSQELSNTLVPGFIPEEGHSALAELLEVPDALWPQLDDWENYDPDNPDDSQYLREKIITAEGREVWVYILHQGQKLNFIRGGDWLRYAHHPNSIPELRPTASWPG